MNKLKSTKLWGFIAIIGIAILDGILKFNISQYAWMAIVGAYAIFGGARAWQNVTAMKNGEKK